MIWSHFYDFGTTLGINLATLGSLLHPFGCTFRVKKHTGGAKGAPRGATTKILSPIWAPFRGSFFTLFHVFDGNKCVLDTRRFFLNFWGALSALGDGLICNPYTYMQSKHTVHFLHVFSKKVPWRVPNKSIWGYFVSSKM